MTHSRTKTAPSELDFNMLVYIHQFTKTHLQGHSPSSGDASEYFGYSPYNAIEKMNTLVKYGYLYKGTGRKKWVLTDKGLEYCRNALA